MKRGDKVKIIRNLTARLEDDTIKNMFGQIGIYIKKKNKMYYEIQFDNFKFKYVDFDEKINFKNYILVIRNEFEVL